MRPSRQRLICVAIGLCAVVQVFHWTFMPPKSTAPPSPPAATRTRLFIGVLSAQSDKAAHQRKLIRRTWLGQLQANYSRYQLAARFFVGRHTGTALMSSEVRAEMAAFDDIVVLNVEDTYAALVKKVGSMFNWVATHHPADYVAKVDDDTYVGVGQLLAELEPLPREQLYFGRMSVGAPVIRREGHRNGEPWLPDGVEKFPPYAMGTGYVLSWDLVQIVAFPKVPYIGMVNEDAYIGVLLFPYNVYRYDSDNIVTHGLPKCIAARNVTMVHLMQLFGGDGKCMDEIHKNVTAGKPVCKTLYCGELNCSFAYPRPQSAKLCNRTGLAWNTTSETLSCEENKEGIKAMFSVPSMRDLSCCQQLCLETCGCVGIDFYKSSTWCRLYDEPCHTPGLKKQGSSSYLLDIPSNVWTGEASGPFPSTSSTSSSAAATTETTTATPLRIRRLKKTTVSPLKKRRAKVARKKRLRTEKVKLSHGRVRVQNGSRSK
eukprot:m.63919 g.63919  ORF g.63919 m.63919 type:complete len:486 (-) comp9689_c1_seq1:174-1631(-)